jgi:hypothetical protein
MFTCTVLFSLSFILGLAIVSIFQLLHCFCFIDLKKSNEVVGHKPLERSGNMACSVLDSSYVKLNLAAPHCIALALCKLD